MQIMMSYGQRVDISGRNERKLGAFNSVFKSIPSSPLRKQSSVDENNQNDLLYVRNNLRPAKSRINSEGGASAAPSFENSLKSPPEDEKKAGSPRLRSRFTRNLSMSSRTKKQLNRRSMPSFKIDEDSLPEEIDLLQLEDNVASHKREQNNSVFSLSTPTYGNSVLAKDTLLSDKSPPPVPPRTSSRNFQTRAMQRPPKSEDFLSVANVRRVASFPESEAPAQKSAVSTMAFGFSPTTTSSSSQSLDEVGSPQGSSPGTSPINRPPLSNESGPGLSRRRSHVVRRKVSYLYNKP